MTALWWLQLLLRTLSPSRSSYGFFAFPLEFFDSYTMPELGDASAAVTCKVLAKVLCHEWLQCLLARQEFASLLLQYFVHCPTSRRT